MTTVNHSSCVKELRKAMTGQPVADWDLISMLTKCKTTVVNVPNFLHSLSFDMKNCARV